MRFIEEGKLQDEVINFPKMDPLDWKIQDYCSESQIFNQQIKFIIKKDDQYLGFGSQKFSLFKHIENKDYAVKFTNENVDFANIILIESEYIYFLFE